MPDFEVVIVGSGFGGSVAACHLAEAGQRVLVLERGREWKPEDYPSVSGKNLTFDVDDPQANHGWLDLRWFNDMAVAQGAGVGGGSLVYANVSVPPPPSTFEKGWPEAITHEKLASSAKSVGSKRISPSSSSVLSRRRAAAAPLCRSRRETPAR